MKKIPFLLCTALLLTGCGTQPSQPETSETKSETTVTTTEAEPETTMTEIPETATDTTKSALPEDVQIVYAAETTDYRHITYAYPVFADNDAVNASVKSYTEKLICEQIEGAWSPEEEIPAAEIQFDLPECPAWDEDAKLSIEMDVTVTRKDDEYISLFYEGLFNVKGTAHPTHIAEGLILDAKTGEVLHLNDLYTVNADLAEFVSEYYHKYGAEQHAEKLGISAEEVPAEMFAETPELMLEWLLHYEEPYTTTTVFMYPDALAFSFPVGHAMGDHSEIRIPYAELETFSSTDISADVNADDFLGVWECGDHMMLTITQTNDGYFAFLLQMESTQVYEEWEYPLYYEIGRLICDGDGVRYAVDETKWDTQMIQERHPDQSAEFSMTADGILWNDRTEHRGDGMVFTFVQDGLI